MSSEFKFKKFTILQEKSAFKVGTDSMLLGALIDADNPKNGLDLGTGTGLLALMIAQKFNQISIDALESDYDSYLECCFNFKNSPWPDRLKAHLGDYYDRFTGDEYDLIFANPPFYVESEKHTKPSNTLTKHTSYNELAQLISLVSRLLSEQGIFWIIVPYSIYKDIIKISNVNNLYINNLTIINSKKNKPKTRVIMSFSFMEKPSVQGELTIRNHDNSYTTEYIDLTRDFHFKSLEF